MEQEGYAINKGINKPIEFRGLKAQYIGLLAVTALGTLVGFGVMYVCGVSAYVCTPLALGLGAVGVARVFRMSKRYGQYGLMKRRARRETPVALRSGSRKVFIDLYRDYARTVG